MGKPSARKWRLKKSNPCSVCPCRYGFNSEGHSVVGARLEDLKLEGGLETAVLGVNLGKNKTSKEAVGDYVAG